MTYLSIILGLGCLSWSGHQIHVSLPINKLLDSGISPSDVPLPHEFLLNKSLMIQLYPSFEEGLTPFFTLNWSKYLDFLTFRGGLNPVTGSLWLTDIAHHHLALSVLFIFAGHMYKTNWKIGHSMKELLESHKGLITVNGHKNLYEIFTNSWNAQLSLNLAMMGSLSIIVAQHMYSMPPYPYLAIDYGTQLSLFTHHMWIGGANVIISNLLFKIIYIPSSFRKFNRFIFQIIKKAFTRIFRNSQSLHLQDKRNLLKKSKLVKYLLTIKAKIFQSDLIN